MDTLGLGRSLAAGAAGALALTAVHQLARATLPDAPRMDKLGARAIVRTLRALGLPRPRGKRLYGAALAGDLVSNTAFFGLVGLGGGARWARGGLLGLLAGAGAVALPPILGLGRAPRGITALGKAETIGIYTLGGLVAGAVAEALTPRLRFEVTLPDDVVSPTTFEATIAGL